MDTTKLVSNQVNENGTATFELGINVQMWAGIYTEPVEGKPDTHEDEHKRYVFNRNKYEEVKVQLLKQAEKIQHDVFKCMGYEAAHLTYREVSWETGNVPSDLVTDNRYTASEDLVFLYVSLAEIWNCIFELECVFEA